LCIYLVGFSVSLSVEKPPPLDHVPAPLLIDHIASHFHIRKPNATI